MKILIIKPEIAEKLRSIEFKDFNRLNPVPAILNGVEIQWLQAELKDNELFKDALQDFETCEMKEIETIEEKYFDTKGNEILPTKTVAKGVETIKYLDSKGATIDPMILTPKTVLTEIQTK